VSGYVQKIFADAVPVEVAYVDDETKQIQLGRLRIRPGGGMIFEAYAPGHPRTRIQLTEPIPTDQPSNRPTDYEELAAEEARKDADAERSAKKTAAEAKAKRRQAVDDAEAEVSAV